jgi:hypothetical protein
MRGAYRYQKGGEVLDIRETFDVSDNFTGTSSRIGFGHTLTVITVQRGTRPTSVSIENGKLSAGIVCSFSEILQLTRRLEKTRTSHTYAMPTDAIFFPLMRCYSGKVIRQIVAQGGSATVIVPDIRDPYNKETVLLPLFEERTAQKLSDETITIDGTDYDTEVFSYVGGAYDDAARFWLVGEMLVRYTFEDWDVQLVEWQRD